MTTCKVKLDILEGLGDLRENESLCDVRLKAEGATFQAHRVVLAAASHYFRAMFTGGFREKEQSEVTLNEITAEGLRCVLDAIYSGEITLSEENVCEVLPVASQLQLNKIVKRCEKFLSSHISSNTCLPYLLISERYDLHSTMKKCNKFILKNFTTISKSVHFRDISRELLSSCVSDERLRVVNGEIEVFRAVLRWYEAHSDETDDSSTTFTNLMQHVRLPLIPNELLVDEVVTCELIKKNTEVMELVGEALKYHGGEKLYVRPLYEGKQFQPRGEQKLVIMRNVASNPTGSKVSREIKLHMIDVTGEEPFENQFSEMTFERSLIPKSLSVVTKGNYLFLFGVESQIDFPRAVAMRYNVEKNDWLELRPPPYRAQIGLAATISMNTIYLLGGVILAGANPMSNRSNYSAHGYQYSIENNSYTTLENLTKPVGLHSAASHGNCVFSAGGASFDNFPSSTEKMYAYDMVGKIWLSRAPMQKKRAVFSLQTLGSKLVACGGCNGGSVEVYDIEKNQWTLVQNGTHSHHHFSATVVLNDTLYIIGGSAKQDDGTWQETDSVSCVDMARDSVVGVASLPIDVSSHTCALLTVPWATSGS